MTDIQPRLRARTPVDLLALVPRLFGFHPTESLVVLAVGGEETPMHARMDLPGDPLELEGIATYVAELARSRGSRRIAAVMYTADALLAEDLADQLHQRSEAVGVQLAVAVRADAERWWTLGLPPAGESPDGTPYDVRSHLWMAQAVADGVAVLGSREELADTLVGRDPDETTRVAEVADALADSLRAAIDAPGGMAAARERLIGEGRWVQDRVRRFSRDGEWLDTDEVARLATLTAVSVEVRDVAWAEIGRADADRHVDLWRDVVRRTPVELQAPAATLLGFAAWLSGNGALAWCGVDRAQQADPDYSLARLLTLMLSSAMPPSAWEPLSEDGLSLFAR